MSLILQAPWTRQPQGAVEVDWSNPITKGLVVETGGHRYTGVRLIDGTVNQSTNTGANVSLAHTRYGKSLSFNGSQANGAASFGDIARGDSHTSATWHLLWKSGAGKVFAKWGSSGTQQSWLIELGASGADLTWVVAQPAFTWFSATGVFSTTDWNNAVFVWRGGTGTSNVSLIVNGVDKSSSLTALGSGATTQINGTGNLQIGVANDGGPITGQVAVARMWKRGLSLNEALELSRNPWGILKPVTRTIGAVISGVTISRPSSDVTTTGWTASSGSVLYDMIDEASASDTDYIISPSLSGSPGPATFGLTSSLASGTYDVRVRARRTASAGEIRVLLQDSGGTTVGTSGWQSLSGSFATYVISVTTTGSSARARIEVQ